MLASLLLATMGIQLPTMTAEMRKEFPVVGPIRSNSTRRLGSDIYITVDKDGRTIFCESADKKSDKEFGSRICRSFKQKRFEPARNLNGESTAGIYVFKNGRPHINSYFSDEEFKYKGVAALLLQIDKSGRVEHCISETIVLMDDRGAALCSRAKQTQFPIIRNLAGEDVSYVRQLTLGINLASS